MLSRFREQRISVVNLLTLPRFPPQAREDVIHMLKTEKTKPEVLEAHYGSAEPEKVLRVLHRDAILAQEKSVGEDVYEKPISEVNTPTSPEGSLGVFPHPPTLHALTFPFKGNLL